jgi:hypothetical protein
VPSRLPKQSFRQSHRTLKRSKFGRDTAQCPSVIAPYATMSPRPTDDVRLRPRPARTTRSLAVRNPGTHRRHPGLERNDGNGTSGIPDPRSHWAVGLRWPERRYAAPASCAACSNEFCKHKMGLPALGQRERSGSTEASARPSAYSRCMSSSRSLKNAVVGFGSFRMIAASSRAFSTLPRRAAM